MAFTLKPKKMKNGKKRKNDDYWIFSVYNIYGRRNPFSIFFAQDGGQVELGEAIQTTANRFSIVGSIVPSVSYNFKF